MSNPAGNNQYGAYRYSAKQVYGFDFETDKTPDGHRTWICQWAISTGTDELFGRSLDTFTTHLMGLVTTERKALFYAHNAKFDLSFLLGWFLDLQEQGWTMKAMVRDGSPMHIEFKKDDMIFAFRDSMKKIPGDLAGMAQMIGMMKLDNPSEGNFEPGWSNSLDYEMDSPDWDYVRNDARIVAVAMRWMHANNRGSISASGETFKQAKRFCNHSKVHGGHSNLFQDRFVHLTEEQDAFCRLAYIGGQNISRNIGITYAEEDAPIYHYDIHSSYPYVMSYCDMPRGFPTIRNTKPNREQALWIGQRRCKIRLKDGLIPWFQFKDAVDNLEEGFEGPEPVELTQTHHVFTLTSVDWKSLEDWYDVTYDENFKETYYIFSSERGFFKGYLDEKFAVKEREEKGSAGYVTAKLDLNGLYGRTGMRMDGSETEIVENGEGWYKWETHTYTDDQVETYVPYAAFCTAYARQRLLTHVKACLEQRPDSVIHCDTDSVIFKGRPVDDPRVPYGDKLGDWGLENMPGAILEAGPKRYIEFKQYPPTCYEDIIGCGMAGIPQKMKNGVPVGMWVEILDHPRWLMCEGWILGHPHYKIESEWLRRMYTDAGMDPDDVNTMKLLPKMAVGGLVLRESTFKLGDSWRLVFRRK